MALDREYTFSYKEDVGGFTSFKSYIPDHGTSLNNRYYTFRFGSIWEHNIETFEPITELEFNSAITISFSEEQATGDQDYTITGSIVGLGLRTNDTLLLDLIEESTGRVFEGVRGVVQDPEIAGPIIRLVDTGINLRGLKDSNSRPDFISRIRRLNFSTVNRNSFYDNRTNRGEPFGSVLSFIINNEPSTVKEFKTLGYEGIGLWDFRVYSDIESEVENEDEIPKVYKQSTLAGIVKKSDLVEREGKFFANIQGTEKDVTNLDFTSITVNGLCKASPIGLAADNTILLEADPGTDVRVGYGLYFYVNTAVSGQPDNYNPTLKYAGTISKIDGRTFTYDRGLSGEQPQDGSYMLYVKNNRIEKSGVKGSYAFVEMTSDDNTHAEIFSVNSEVVASSR